MKTYRGALIELRKQGRWEVLKMRCFSMWIGIEARVMPERSKARARAWVGKL